MFSGIMAELTTGQALFGRHSWLFFLLYVYFYKIFFQRVKVISINYIVFKNV